MDIALVPFVVTAVVLIILPGPDTTVVLRSILAGGGIGGTRTAIGVCCGLVVWLLVAVAGLTALLTASRVGYDIVKVAGAGYLAWLGIRTLAGSIGGRSRRGARAGRTGEAAGVGDDRGAAPGERVPGERPPGERVPGATAGRARRGRRAGGGFLAGLTTDVLNPKVGVLFVSLLPQFAGHGSATLAIALLGVAYIVGTAAWFALLIRLAGLIAGWLGRVRVQRWLQRVTGAVLLGFAVDLLADSR